MAETTYSHMRNRLLKSSDSYKDVWINGDPGAVIQTGYAEAFDFTPTQAQVTDEAETKGHGPNDAQTLTPTAIDYHDQTMYKICIPDPPPANRNWVTMHALQEWEGYVLHKADHDFVARLRDLTAESFVSQAHQTEEEEATIPLTEVADEDLHRLRPGSVFRWVIGYERAATGTKRRISQIVFRDLPSITEEDESAGIEWARKILQSLHE